LALIAEAKKKEDKAAAIAAKNAPVAEEVAEEEVTEAPAEEEAAPAADTEGEAEKAE
jgi:small subunit ribosomal protein S16